MIKVIVQNIKTKVKKEVDKNLVSDYVSTKEWEIYDKSKVILNHKKEETKHNYSKLEDE